MPPSDAELLWQSIGHGLANGVSLGCLLGLLAVGYSLVYGVARLINFAHGEVFVLGGYFAWVLLSPPSPERTLGALLFSVPTGAVVAYSLVRGRHSGPRAWAGAAVCLLATCAAVPLLAGRLPLIPAIAVALGLTAVAGVAFEYCVYRPLDGSSRLTYLVAAMGLSLTLQGAMQIVFGTARRSFPASTSAGLESVPVSDALARYFSGLDLAIIVCTAIVTATAAWAARYTDAGLAVRAVADDPRLASAMGVDVRRARVHAFAAGALLAGLSAFFFVARQRVLEPTLGYSQGILAFAAAVIGGIGRLHGALLGGLFIGMTLSLLPLLDLTPAVARLPEHWGRLLPSANLSDWGLGIVYLLMTLILAFRPRGLAAEQQWRDL